MSIQRFMFFMVVIAVCMTLIGSCSENNCVVCDEEDLVEFVNVSGIVYAYYCRPLNGYNGSTRYSVSTGEKAVIKFLRLDDFSFVFETDDSSNYDKQIDTGVYDIIVECGHAFPDTSYNVEIKNDTSIDFVFYYHWEEADSIILEYYYSQAEDSLGDSTERYHLNYLNSKLGGAIDLDHPVVNRSFGDLMPYYRVKYTCAVDSNFYAWQVMQAANSILSTHEYMLPEELDVYKYDIFCLF